MYDLLDGRLMRPNPLRWNHTLTTQEVNKLSQRRGIAATDLEMAGAGSQIPNHMPGGYMAGVHSLPSEPAAKTRRKKNLPLPGIQRIALIAGPSRKPGNVS
jgi:hypothetical protein